MSQRRSLAIGLVTLSTAVALGQGAPPVIGSTNAGLPTPFDPSSEQEVTTELDLTFAEVPAREVDLMITRLRGHRVGPFEGSGAGIRSVDVYFDRTYAPAEERSALQSNATLQPVLVVQMADRTRYFRLRPGGRHDSSLLRISDESNEREQVRIVSGSPTTPVIDVQYGSEMMGANSGVAYTRHLLIDLRSGSPRIVALLTDAVHEGGGACTAYDSVYDRAREVGCRWDASLGDFRCAETYHRFDTDWGRRRGTRTFTVAGNERPDAEPSTLQALEALARDADGREGSVAHVPSLGPVTILRMRRFPGSDVVLMGSPLLTDELREPFGARLHVAVLRPGQNAQVTELRPRSSLEELVRPEFAAPWTAPDVADAFTPDGVLPTFHVREVALNESLTVLQITVAEGRGRGVYLVGVEGLSTALVADAVLVATDALTYDSCNEWKLPTTAVAMTTRAAPFSAILDVEPAYRVDSEARDTTALRPREPEDPCGAEVTFQWQV